MNSERAIEILIAGSRYCNWHQICTKEENEEIKAIWRTMPGHTCWYDALCRIAQGQKEAIS